jgi:hypothetical protein
LENAKDRFKASYLPVTFRTPANSVGLFFGHSIGDKNEQAATAGRCPAEIGRESKKGNLSKRATDGASE